MHQPRHPLSAAQTSIWYAQHLLPDVAFSIAYYVDLIGAVQHERVLACAATAHRDYGSSTLRIVEHEGVPHQIVDSAYRDDAQTVDLRAEADPAGAALEWMQRDAALHHDIENSPLVRTAVLRLTDERCFWYTKVHHIALDGYGATAVLRRAAELYIADTDSTQDGSSEIPRLADLLAEDAAYQASARHDRDAEYWRDRIAAATAPRTLSGATAPPTSPQLHVAGTLDSAARLDASSGTAMTPVLIAAFAAYLARMMGEDDVVLSLPVSARTSARLRKSAGTVANVLPLYLPGIGALTVSEAVKATSTALSGVLRHQRYRPESDDTAAATERMAAGGFGPVVNVMMFDRTVTVGDISGDVHVLTTGPTPDIALDIYPGTADLPPNIDFEANAAAYSIGEVEEHHRRFLRSLDAFTDPAHRSTPIADLDLSFDAPDRSITHGQHCTRSTTLAEVLTASVDRFPDAIAVRETDRDISYRDLDRQSNQLAQELIRRGVEPDDLVPVLIARSIRSVVALWAVAKAGAAYVPVDPKLPADRVRYIVGDCAVRIGLCSSRQDLPDGIDWISVPDGPPDAAKTDNVRVAVDPDNAAYVIYTSGSTGTPKGVVVTHAGLGGLVTEIEERYRLDAASRVLHFASPGFDTALVEVFAACSSGATLVIAPIDVYGGTELTALLAVEKITHLLATPSALATVDPTAATDLAMVIMGGEAAPESMVDRWIAAGHTVRNAYGPSETTCSVTITEPLITAATLGIGTPMPGVIARVLDRRLRPAPRGAVGELYLTTPAVARGYLGRFGWTASRFVADPNGTGVRMFRTGDRVRWNSDGSLEFLGRADDQVKLRGFRIELGEIDATLRSADGVAFAVTVVDGTGAHARLASYVVAESDAAVDTEALKSHVEKQLPHYMVPKSIIEIDTVPLTPNRKLDHSALPAPTFDSSPATVTDPMGPTEVAIAHIFGAVLGLDRVDVHTSFFDLGGDSLFATRAVGRVNAHFMARIGVRDLLTAPTVSALARVVDAQAPADDGRPVAGSARAGSVVPLAPSQRHIDRAATVPHHNLPFVVTLRGNVDVEALYSSIADLIERHRTLRTTYPDTADGPIQRLGDVPDRPTAVTECERNGLDRAVTAFLHKGFDVRSEQPIRWAFFRARPDELVVACVVHHIAADGWSLRILARDLSHAFASRTEGRAPDWAPLAVEFADYTVWRLRADIGADVDFWRGELAGAAAELPLDADRPRPVHWTYSGARTHSRIEPALVERLDAIARANNAGIFSVLRAALLVVLADRSGRTDIVIGTPTAGRSDPLLDYVVGMFVNTLPIRTNIAGAQSLSDVVERARDTETRALEHADAQFDHLVDVLDPPRSASLHPFFQVAMSLDTVIRADLNIDGVEFAVQPRPLDIAKCDLHFAFAQSHDEAGHSIELDVLYSTDMFDATTVAEIADSFHSVVAAICDDATGDWSDSVRRSVTAH